MVIVLAGLSIIIQENNLLFFTGAQKHLFPDMTLFAEEDFQ